MDTFIITSEHGGNRIPAPSRQMFPGHGALRDSHHGYDPGAPVMAKELASACRAPLVASTVSRLLIDLNRSICRPQLFSAVTRCAPTESRAQIAEQQYRPYRDQVERLTRQTVSRGHRLVHISSHSITAELTGNVRVAPAPALRADQLPRNRTGGQPTHSLWRSPTLAGAAAQTDRFITHGM
jgi:predicted N-formylglutamate amidohydrolase